MIEINGHTVSSFPLEGFSKVSHLIEFEGPLLSHFRDKFNHQFLFYWVDNDNQYNRWLLWETQEQFIYKYLTRDLSLDEIFPKSDEQIYVVDIDSKAEYKSTKLLYCESLPSEYYPENMSYFEFDVPEIYEEKLQLPQYTEVLIEKALYFNIKAASRRYGGTVGIEDIWEVFQNLGKSFKAFVSFSVAEALRKTFIDDRSLKVAVNSLSDLGRLRIVHLNLNSFHVGIAADTLNVNSQSMEIGIEGYKENPLDAFKNEVLDHDFNSPSDVDALLAKFSDEEVRKKIFNPIIKIINNDNIKININNHSKSFNKDYIRITDIERNKISPIRKRIVSEPETLDPGIYQAYLLGNKESDTNTLFGSDFRSRILFTAYKGESIDDYEISKIILPNGTEVLLKVSIKLEISIDEKFLTIACRPLNIVLEKDSFDDALKSFNETLAALYLEYIAGDEVFKDFFVSHL